eukprot:scaffold9150_cov120-Isochrysis_galbana.AAC.4
MHAKACMRAVERDKIPQERMPAARAASYRVLPSYAAIFVMWHAAHSAHSRESGAVLASSVASACTRPRAARRALTQHKAHTHRVQTM